MVIPPSFSKEQVSDQKNSNKMAFIDYALPLIIIGGLVLAIWAKVSGQTVGDLLRDLVDFFNEKKEDTAETTMGVYER